LAKAFRGELVAQDPEDEPAEKLLERIITEKTQMEKELKQVQKGRLPKHLT
jgi:type I restriction enzyme S subunit